jgi:hypothetical protein
VVHIGLKGSPTCAGVLYVAPTCCFFYRLSWRSQTVQKRRQVFVRVTIGLPRPRGCDVRRVWRLPSEQPLLLGRVGRLKPSEDKTASRR